VAKRYLIGVDEAGRGPLAGPVAVSAVVTSGRSLDSLIWPRDSKGKKIRLADSKGLSAARREYWYSWLKRECAKKRLNFAVSLVGEKTIDRLGIAPAVRIGIKRVLRRLEVEPVYCHVLLDGGLKAPTNFSKQETIIRGDTIEPIIMLASIAAKVKRDRRLVKLARRYPHYGFEFHKGYGTKAHYAALRRHGLSLVHRKSFLKSLRP